MCHRQGAAPGRAVPGARRHAGQDRRTDPRRHRRVPPTTAPEPLLPAPLPETRQQMEVQQGNRNCNHSLKREKPARCAGIPLEPLNECCLTVKRMPLSPEPPPTAQQAVGTERGFPRLPGGITGQTPHQLPSQPENCSRRRSGCRLLHRMLRSLRSLRRPPSTPEKRTFQLCLDTRIDITAPLGDDGSDTTAHSCSVVASAATSTVHHSVATSTTHMGKLLPRIDGGGGGGCPILAIGITRSLYVED